MFRHVRRSASLLLAVVVAVIWLAPATEAKEPNPIVQLAKKLAEPVDFPALDDPKTTLQDVLDLLAQKDEVRFDVNEKAFQMEGVGQGAAAIAPLFNGNDLTLLVADDKRASSNKPVPGDKAAPPGKPAPPPPPAANAGGDVGSSLVAIKPIPKMTRVRLSTVLNKILARVPSSTGATYVLRRDGIEITTEGAKVAEFRNASEHLPPGLTEDRDPNGPPPAPIPLVQAEFDKKSLDEALKELADATEHNVLLDPRAAEKAKPVTATLINVPLDTAVDLLANMSGLQVVSRDRVLYVTTKDNADAMQKELKDRIGPVPTPMPAQPGGPLPLPLVPGQPPAPGPGLGKPGLDKGA